MTKETSVHMVLTAAALLSIASSVPISAQDKPSVSLMDAIGDELFRRGWIYEDIEAGYAEARKRGWPLLVSFR